MTHPLNNLKSEAAKLRLTHAEKSAMKARIFALPMVGLRPRGVPSPKSMAPKQSPYFFFSYQFLHARVLMPAMAVLIVFVGTGTAAAAQGALPGDLLYSIKVSVNETVEIALATTPVAKAEVSAKLAERRVEEAEALAVRGELTAQIGETLAANFEAHAQSAHDSANEVETEDPAAAAQLRTKLDSSLSAHGAILATISGGTAENQEGAGVVAAKVLARTDAQPADATLSLAKAAAPAEGSETVAMTMSVSVATDTEATVSLEGDMIEDRPEDPMAARAAVKLQGRATEALADARGRFEADKEDLSAATITRVSGEFANIDKLMEQGSTTLSAREYEAASEAFVGAYKKAIKLSVLLRAQAKLERNIIEPILEQKLIQSGAGAEGQAEAGLPSVL